VRKRERPASRDPDPPAASEDEAFRALSAELRKWIAKTDPEAFEGAWQRLVQYKEKML
jgi:hypothetical protein